MSCEICFKHILLLYWHYMLIYMVPYYTMMIHFAVNVVCGVVFYCYE